jgi:hypothetical protein
MAVVDITVVDRHPHIKLGSDHLQVWHRMRADTAIFPGLWLYGAYVYIFNHPYYFHNASYTTDSAFLLVTCLCQQYNACGCDDDGNTSYLDSLLGD